MCATPYNNRFNTDSAWPSRPLLGWVNTGLVLRQRSRRNPPFRVLSRPRKGGPQLRGLIERYTDGGPNRAHRVQTLSTSLTLSIRLHPISKGWDRCRGGVSLRWIKRSSLSTNGSPETSRSKVSAKPSVFQEH